jgi:hypothetical protein
VVKNTEHVHWEQWVDKDMLCIVGTTNAKEVLKGRIVIAVYRDGQWEDVTQACSPESTRPVDMEIIAMWSEMPAPNLKLLEGLK